MVRLSTPTMRTSVIGRVAALTVVGVTVSMLAACASAPHAANRSTGPAVNEKLHAGLPAPVRAAGVLHMVTDASYPPASSFAADGRTIVGFEPDLGRAIGAVLGLKVIVSDRDFKTLPALVQARKADLIMSAMTDTAEREKLVDFVDYFLAGTSFVVQRGNPQGIVDLDTLCGQKVAVEENTVQSDLLKREQRRCKSNPIRLDERPTNDDALLQLRTGRAAAVPMDFPPAELLTTSKRTSDEYQLASTEQYEPGPYGIGVAKARPRLRDSIRAALGELIRTGAYQRILKKWHVESGAVHQADVNVAGGGN